MKGLLYKIPSGWVVRWSSPQEYRIPVHEIELHPADVRSKEPSVLGSHGEVEFEVVATDCGAGLSKSFAKIVQKDQEVKNKSADPQDSQTLDGPKDPSPEDRLALLEELAEKLSQAWFYGDWKPETANEREMEKVMRNLGYWPRPNKLKINQ